MTTGNYSLKVSVSTKLHKRGLFVRRPTVSILFNSANKRVRLAWCIHTDWRIDQWATIIFIDESPFSITNDSWCTLLGRKAGSHSLLSSMREIDQYGIGSSMFWICILLHDCTPIQVFERCSVSSVIYRDGVLDPRICPFRGVSCAWFHLNERQRTVA